MSASLNLDHAVLAARDEGYPLDLCVAVELGSGEVFGLRIRRLPVTHYTEPIDPARKPTPQEGAEVIAALCLDMLKHDHKQSAGRPSGQLDDLEAGVEPDFEAGWQAYREELRDTAGYPLPAWAELPAEVREAFCAGVRATVGAEDRWGLSEGVISEQGSVISAAEGVPTVDAGEAQ
jgi:hypothetical protein